MPSMPQATPAVRPPATIRMRASRYADSTGTFPRASFAWNQASERWPRRRPKPSARKIQHEAGDREQRHQRRGYREQQPAGPSEDAAAVDIEDARQDLLADGLVRVDLR